MYSKLEDGDYGLHCKVISANEIDDLIKNIKILNVTQNYSFKKCISSFFNFK